MGEKLHPLPVPRILYSTLLSIDCAIWLSHVLQEQGTIRIVDKGPGCSRPMVKEGVTPPSFCDCTLGWQEAAYSTILGRPVRAELEESILRGG